MQNIVIDKPYEFVPPYPGRLWLALFRPFLPGYIRRQFGVREIVTNHAERLGASIAAGHSVVLAPNHSRESDPLVLEPLTRQVKTPFFIMASWHLFMQSAFSAFVARRIGAFSIYREGMDRQALSAATAILENNTRPLVMFPEGVVSRANDHINALMDGVALIARQAARKRARANPPGKVVVHPVGIRYQFIGPDLSAAIVPVLEEIEHRLSWQTQKHLSLQERLIKLGRGLLALKEIEYFGQPRPGTIGDRLPRLIDHILVPLEEEWCGGKHDESTVSRVKRIRMAILPDMIKGDIDEAERARRWRQLADVYLAQSLSLYRPDYIASNPTPERLLETVERFEEDLTDRVRPHPLRATVTVGEAIEVPPERGGPDLMDQVDAALRQLLGIAPAEQPVPPAAQPA